jgi:hypothetical protein
MGISAENHSLSVSLSLHSMVLQRKEERKKRENAAWSPARINTQFGFITMQLTYLNLKASFLSKNQKEPVLAHSQKRPSGTKQL